MGTGALRAMRAQRAAQRIRHIPYSISHKCLGHKPLIDWPPAAPTPGLRLFLLHANLHLHRKHQLILENILFILICSLFYIYRIISNWIENHICCSCCCCLLFGNGYYPISLHGFNALQRQMTIGGIVVLVSVVLSVFDLRNFSLITFHFARRQRQINWKRNFHAPRLQLCYTFLPLDFSLCVSATGTPFLLLLFVLCVCSFSSSLSASAFCLLHFFNF